MKAEMEKKEKDLRVKIKKATQERSKLLASFEGLRQQKVDLLSESDTLEMQVAHLDNVNADRSRTLSAVKTEEEKLTQELTEIRASTKKSTDTRKKVAQKYGLVVNQNKKMASEIAKYSSLVNRGETELEFSPANKRIRLHQDKL